MEVLFNVASAVPSSPVFRMRRFIVLTPVEEAAWITNMLSNELVACTKTRSLVVSALAGVVVQSVYLVVEAVKLVTSANEQYPNTRPFIVGAAGSSPTISAEVLAVPTNFSMVVPRVIVPSVALVIVSPLSKVMEVLEAIPLSCITPSVALLIISPFKRVRVVVVAPPKSVAKPATLRAPAELIVVVAVPPK